MALASGACTPRYFMNLQKRTKQQHRIAANTATTLMMMAITTVLLVLNVREALPISLFIMSPTFGRTVAGRSAVSEATGTAAAADTAATRRSRASSLFGSIWRR